MSEPTEDRDVTIEEANPRSEEELLGAIDALILILFSIQPLVGHDAEMHEKFHSIIFENFEDVFGLSREEIAERIETGEFGEQTDRYVAERSKTKVVEYRP